nr:DUF1905 domain-containing protein [Angustibacter aerolatus]
MDGAAGPDSSRFGVRHHAPMEPRTFRARIWPWEAQSGWAFVSLPDDLSDEIAEAAVPARGFGAVPVEVRAGTTVWRTSVFPDKGRGCYVLPLKQAVRRARGVDVGDDITLDLGVL